MRIKVMRRPKRPSSSGSGTTRQSIQLSWHIIAPKCQIILLLACAGCGGDVWMHGQGGGACHKPRWGHGS